MHEHASRPFLYDLVHGARRRLLLLAALGRAGPERRSEVLGCCATNPERKMVQAIPEFELALVALPVTKFPQSEGRYCVLLRFETIFRVRASAREREREKE